LVDHLSLTKVLLRVCSLTVLFEINLEINLKEIRVSNRSDLGNYAEKTIVPIALEQAQFSDWQNLNDKNPNAPWADFRARMPNTGEWALINVKSRVRWERPRESRLWSWQFRSFWTRNRRYRSAGANELAMAQSIWSGRPLWMAISFDVDQTCSVWWGEQREMCNASKPDLWAIDMRDAALAAYARKGRCIAASLPHAYDWTRYADDWTSVAHGTWKASGRETRK
jgi:hypothetical protein